MQRKTLILMMLAVLLLATGQTSAQQPAAQNDPASSSACFEGGLAVNAATYACLRQDLVDPSYFVLSGGTRVEQSAADTETTAETADAADMAQQTPTGELTSQPRSTNPTAYIDASLRWRAQGTAATLSRNNLDIPVCWINPSTDPNDRAGRDLTKKAVQNTWHNLGQVRFTGWTRCLPGKIGGIRIRIADEGPRAYVGRLADKKPTGMWLNFTFKNWGADCANRQAKKSKITWDNCVFSIAVHEFGHALGFLHEHDRLFHGVNYHALSPTELATHIDACKQAGHTKATTTNRPTRFISTKYDPVSVMNYCFDIYDHEAAPSQTDFAGMKKAYP